MNLTEFIEQNKITIKNTKVDKNPNMDNFEGDHWKCVIKMNGKQMTTYFSKGYGHKGKVPDIAEVLEAMSMDVRSVEDYDVCDFVDEFGYKCIEGRRIYKACIREKEQMESFFGSLYDVLVHEIEEE